MPGYFDLNKPVADFQLSGGEGGGTGETFCRRDVSVLKNR